MTMAMQVRGSADSFSPALGRIIIGVLVIIWGVCSLYNLFSLFCARNDWCFQGEDCTKESGFQEVK